RGHRLDVLSVAFCADGSRLATASWDGTTRVWHVDSGALVQTFTEHTEPVRAVEFSPDGTMVITASRDGTARVLDVSTGEPRHTLEHGGPLVDAMFSPDGRRVVTLGADDTMRVWSATTGESVSAFVPEGAVTAVAISPDGSRLATAAKDGSVRTWSAESGEALTVFRGHSAPVSTMAFSPDGTQLATGGEDGAARVWETASGALVTMLPHAGPVTSVAWSADGRRLATASGDELARLWSLEVDAWHTWGCAVLEERQGHTDDTRRACSQALASRPQVQPTPPAKPLVSTPEAARPEPETITVHGVELVLIPGGTFIMGSPPGEHDRRDHEGPQHEVTLSSFYMARTPVTHAQYALYREANPGVPEPPGWGDERFNQPEQPVIGLTWYEAKAYCDWAGLELPTEAQWEYAARAGSTTAYWFGDETKDL
ncbi:MAG: SUMF1/EgtB/PvdO family nonheme iron enzyme, partial [Myxococcales bacterium]|nr:SUMF1/EgtB/PvdO family nonheme iron enzyme [Myxococcales bacterium]